MCSLDARNLAYKVESTACYFPHHDTVHHVLKKSPFWHHRTTLSGCIFATEAFINNRKKKLVKHRYPSSINISPSTSFQPLCLCPSCSCSYHFFSLCQLNTLTIHNSLSLSLPAQYLPLPQIFPSIDSLPASGLTPRTSRLDRFF